MAERIGKTLDKISSPSSSSSSSTSSKNQPHQYAPPLPAWVYPVQYNTQPVYNGQSRLAAATSLLYPWESPSPSSSSSPYDQPCSCRDLIYGGSVSGRSCVRHGRKSRSNHVGKRASLAGVPPTSSSLRGGWSYRDPYEYMRQTRIGFGKSSEDWQTFWGGTDQEEDHVEDHHIRTSPKKVPSNKDLTSRGDRILVKPSPPLPPPSSSSSSSQEVEGREIASGTTSSSPQSRPSFRRSILGPAANPYELNNNNCTADEGDEDAATTKCKNIKPENSGFKGVVVDVVADSSSEEEEANNRPTLCPSSSSSLQHRLSSANVQSVKHGRSRHHHRIFYRRRPHLFQIEEAILEEDEDSIEEEEKEEKQKLRSILKQQKSENEETKPAPSSQEGRGEEAVRKKEVKFTERHTEIGDVAMGATASTAGVTHQPSPETEKKFSSDNGSSSVSSSSGEDEWSGYDKVIVSHNLAEEILDEIYGKAELIEPGVEKAKKASSSSSSGSCSSSSSSTSSCYEEFDFKGESATVKKSMADEILDELYGRTSSSPKPELASSSPDSKKKNNNAKVSKDDSEIAASEAVLLGKKSVRVHVDIMIVIAAINLYCLVCVGHPSLPLSSTCAYLGSPLFCKVGVSE